MFGLGAGFWALGSLGASLLDIVGKNTKPVVVLEEGVHVCGIVSP